LELPYHSVKQALMDSAGITSRQAIGMLATNPVIKTRKDEKTGARIAVLQQDYKDIFARSGARFPSKKPTLMQQIDGAVRMVLESAPEKQMSLAELVASLQVKFDRPKPTLYSYISRLEYVERLDVPSSKIAICRIKGYKGSLSFPVLSSISNEKLRQNLERALPLLTEDYVDIGLFLIGKEFEATLKGYLIAGVSGGKLTSKLGPDPDKWKLVNMVDCLRENNALADQAALQYLRQERNNRAHGAAPSLAERQLLMKNVQFVAGIYMDYCKLFDDLAGELK